MSRRKIWSQHEDAVLRTLRDEQGLKRWSEIARQMDEQFGIRGRTGKQCRERYHNHLDASIVLRQWSQEEERTLHGLHSNLGNKWSAIAQQLPGRSDNCVKNHFYSKLRKAVRKINRLIHTKPSLASHPVSPSLLNTLIQLTEERFKHNSKYEEEIIDKSVQIIDRLFRFQKTFCEAGASEGAVKRLVEDAMWVEARARKGRGRGEGGRREGGRESRAGEWGREKEESTQEGRGGRQEGDCFYQAFRRVCQSIVLNNN